MHVWERTTLALGHNATLGTLADRLAKVHGSRRLVEESAGGLTVTYAQAAKRVRRWSGGVAAHAQPGEVVVVAAPNGYEQLLLCLAVARAGALPAPVNAQMTEDEISHVVRDSGARLVLHGAADVDSADPLAEAIPAEPDDVAALFYTSGTTGKPKGVELTHRALVGQVTRGVVWPTHLRHDEAVVSLPIAHIMGFGVALSMACAGIPVYFLPSFHPVRVLDAIEQRRASIFIGVPAMYRMLLEAGAEQRNLRSVRVWLSGADAMPADLASKFKKMGATAELPLVGPVGEAMFAEGYGMVESGGGVAAKFSPPGMGLGLGEAVGFALPGYRFKVVDADDHETVPGAVGELLVRGPGVTKGYRGDADATAGALTADGWLRTGDMGRKGPFGMVFFAGRAKDVIKHGGYSVYALEVERALEEHPDILEAAVVGVEHPTKGEVPAAAVRLRDGQSLDGMDLGGWAAQRLSDYKVPTRFIAVDDLPRTGTRKVQRAQVAEWFRSGRGSSGTS